jgi:hypothetical protein
MEQNNLFSKLRHYIAIALFTFITLSIITNCTEKALEIDPSDILPDNDMLDVIFDSIPVELYTIPLEAIETRSIGISPLGVVNDTVIGIIETDFICDFIFDNELDLGSNNDPDSIDILDMTVELSYETSYGDSTDVDFNVYELLEPMPAYTKSDYIMYSHMFSQEPINDGPPFQGRLTSSEDDTLGVYSIKLKSEFAERFIDTALINYDFYSYTNVEQFKETFKGFYFAVEPRAEAGGGIILVNHLNSSITLRILQLKPDSTNWDTLSITFSLGNPNSEMDDGGVHLNLYRSILNNKISQLLNDTITEYTSAYVHSLTGTKVYVKLPILPIMRDTLNNAVSVNRAQLILPIDSIRFNEDNESYPPPLNLGIYDSKSNSVILDDALAENHLGGYLDIDNYQYVLNIGNHIHEYLRNDSSSLSPSFFLFASKGSPASHLEYTPCRVVLNGSKSVRPPYVRIIYSKIPE